MVIGQINAENIYFPPCLAYVTDRQRVDQKQAVRSDAPDFG